MPTRILLVEDNADMGALIREVLHGAADLQVAHTARTGPSACTWIHQNPTAWDLAVIDIFLSEGHGFDVLRSCNELDPRRPAVLLTNYTREPVRSRAAALGAAAVFDKLFELDAFVAYCAQFARRG